MQERSKEARKKCIVLRMQRRKLAIAFSGLIDCTEDSKRRRHVASIVLRRMRHRGLSRSLETWLSTFFVFSMLGVFDRSFFSSFLFFPPTTPKQITLTTASNVVEFLYEWHSVKCATHHDSAKHCHGADGRSTSRFQNFKTLEWSSKTQSNKSIDIKKITRQWCFVVF